MGRRSVAVGGASNVCENDTGGKVVQIILVDIKIDKNFLVVFLKIFFKNILESC